MKKIGWVCFFGSILLCVSCYVSLVPSYSSELELEIARGAKMTDKLYVDLLNAELDKRTFQLYANRYSEVEAEIHDIQFKNEIRKNNNDMLIIIKNLDSAFMMYKKEHKNKSSALTDGEILIYQTYTKAFWKPLLMAEGGLKKAR